MKVTWCAALGVLFLTCASSKAWATPQPLPFSYVYQTLPQGDLEVEQYVDLVPVKVGPVSSSQVYLASQFQTEFEYGITDRLELGLYVTLAPGQSANTPGNVPRLTEGTGAKERLRLRLAEEGQWPIDVGLYGEVVETESEIELEAKILLQRRIGDLRIVANLWAAREWYYTPQSDWEINPTLGVTYQVTPMFHPGIESWLHAEFPTPTPSPFSFNNKAQVYVGPTMMVDFGKLWWSTGVYVRTTYFGRELEPNVDAFGAIWARTVIGLSL